MQQTKRRGEKRWQGQAFLQVCTVGRARVPGCKILYTGALLIPALGDCAPAGWGGTATATTAALAGLGKGFPQKTKHKTEEC